MIQLEPSLRRPRVSSVAPVSLADIARRVAELWSIEPHVTSRRRSELLGELHTLESELETLLLRAAAGTAVQPDRVRQCAQRYLWLRQHWGVHWLAP